MYKVTVSSHLNVNDYGDLLIEHDLHSCAPFR